MRYSAKQEAKQHVCVRAGERCRGGAAHLEHLVHAGHARKVPSKRLIKSLCILRDVRWTCMVAGGFSDGFTKVEASGAVHLEHLVHAGHV